jgi:hypothetical protein
VIKGATVTILDGPNAGRTETTDNEGHYQFQGLTQGNANFSVTAPGFLELRTGGVIDADVNVPASSEYRSSPANFALQRVPAP